MQIYSINQQPNFGSAGKLRNGKTVLAPKAFVIGKNHKGDLQAVSSLKNYSLPLKEYQPRVLTNIEGLNGLEQLGNNKMILLPKEGSKAPIVVIPCTNGFSSREELAAYFDQPEDKQFYREMVVD